MQCTVVDIVVILHGASLATRPTQATAGRASITISGARLRAMYQSGSKRAGTVKLSDTMGRTEGNRPLLILQ
jgi:hypothetical protein